MARAEVYAQSAHTVTLFDQSAVDEFYSKRDGAPFWMSGTRLNAKGRALLRVLEYSWQNGLNPKKYHTDLIAGLSGVGEDDALYQELLLSDAFVRYVRDMSGMRVVAGNLGLNVSDWRQPPENAAGILAFLSDDIEIDAFLSLLEPQGQTYQKMKLEMIRLVEEERRMPAFFKRIDFKGVLSPGMSNNAVSDIRAHLTGEPSGMQGRSDIYDDDLVALVRDFQQAHGLKADGIIGPDTLLVMNRGREDKIRQLVVNMERLRWVEDEKPRRFVVVNVPSQTLWAIEDGGIYVEMPVVVGRPDRPTPTFRTNITGVRFHPSWTMPKTIMREDIWPKLREDPFYLTGKGVEVYDGYGPDAQTLDPSVIDWRSISIHQLYGFRFVQTPGEHNPLGWIRILMPNKYDVYLHDTNHRELFSQADRMQSSGCVRMKYPEKMAQFVMAGREGWDDSSLISLSKTKKTLDLQSTEKIPIFFLYYTAWIGPQGEVVYGNDIYGQDKKLLENLQLVDGIDNSIYPSRIAVNAVE